MYEDLLNLQTATPEKTNSTEWCFIGCWRGTAAIMNEWTLNISQNLARLHRISNLKVEANYE